jgi:hypothetical protein
MQTVTNTPEPLLDRESFRSAIFARDNHRCVLCGAVEDPAAGVRLDAHHIIERRLFADGGYFISNGATLCDVVGADGAPGGCHLKSEQTLISPEELRAAAGIVRIVLPATLSGDDQIDKWGNVVLADGRRSPGELFTDPSVQKVLASGCVLDLFTHYVKFPRTPHLPWSPGGSDDDIALDTAAVFEGREIVVTAKLDGENTSVYWDGTVHARSLDSRSHPSQAWIRNFAQDFCYELPFGWRAVMENLYAQHSIVYDGLPSYAFLISLWNERNECLSWDETVEWATLLGVEPVPLLYRGLWDEQAVKDCYPQPLFSAEAEGYVVRLADSFPYAAFRSSVAKMVRPGHVTTDTHWRARNVVPNTLA